MPHQHENMPDMMWQQATRGFKQVLNQTRLSRNVTGIFKFVLAHNCRFELVDELITKTKWAWKIFRDSRVLEYA